MPASPFSTFAHLTTQNVALYRGVMGEFLAAKRRFVVHLRLEDVHDALVYEGSLGQLAAESVADALAQLVEWGNLRADPDTSRVTTVEDFHRARYLYQLTAAGEAAERALAVYDEQLGRRGALQAVALEDIASQLRGLIVLAGEPMPDAARVGLALRDLLARSTDLAENAQAFMGSLRRTIDLYDADAEAFRAYKDHLIAYLERFIKDLVTIGGKIAALLDELPEAQVSKLISIAARREAEDAAPGGDAGVEDHREAAYLAGAASWEERWRGLREWFISEPGRPSQAKLLRSRARQAIPDLLAVVATLNERRSGRSDRSADFRTLALWFAQAPDDAALRRLWRSAFGLYGARHLMLDRDTLAEREEQPVPAGTPWAQAPPLRISPRLRRTGSYERRGSPSRIESREQGRRLLAQLLARQSAQTAAARARLATSRPTHLGELRELDEDAFDLFLALLGEALSARRAGEREVHATTADGTLEVRLTELADAPLVEIRTPAGVFRGPDHVIEINDLMTGAGAPGAEVLGARAQGAGMPDALEEVTA